MTNLTKEQKKALDEFRQIGDVLTVPTLGKSLPEDRKWTLPRLDEKALADYPRPRDEVQSTVGQTLPPAEESKSGESYVKDSPIQTGRK